MSSFEKTIQKGPAPAEKDTVEKEGMEKRREKLLSRAEQVFTPEQFEQLRPLIERSFQVPQLGEYHTEGMYMDTHLEIMLDAVDSLAQGKVDSILPKDVQVTLKEVAKEHGDLLTQYVFLHDVAKADSLKLVKGKKEFDQITWDEWQASLPDTLKRGDDPELLRTHLKAQGYKQVSYPKHGPKGESLLEGIEGLDPLLLHAVKKHEVGFQFKNISAKVYEKHFGDLSQQERNVVFAASFIDTSAAVRPNGRPDLHDFVAMVESRNNAEYIAAIEEAVEGDSSLDPAKVQKELSKLNKQNVVLSERTLPAVIQEFRKKTAPDTYNAVYLAKRLDELVVTEEIPEQARQLVLEAMDETTGFLDNKAVSEGLDALVANNFISMKDKIAIFTLIRKSKRS
jgi:hypothetical protein